MQNANSQYEADSDLNELLKTWDAPALPASLDQRVLASYRQEVNRVPFWQRFFTASIRIPVPLAAAAMLLVACLSGGTVMWLRGATSMSQQAAVQTAAQPLSVPTPTTIKEVVQVPVVQERIVTRVVYVTKKAPSLMTSLPPASPAKELKLSSHVAGDNAYTNVDLAGYQPVEEMKVRIIKGSAPNEH